MPRPLIIVDGYNVMHAAGLAKQRYPHGVLERCRQNVLGLLASLLDEDERHRTVVVFDAQHAPPDAVSQTTAFDILVQYAEPGTEADDFIELLIETHSSRRHLMVVSSDHRLQKAARRRHGESIGSDVFLRHLEHRKRLRRDAPVPAQPPSRSTVRETDFWVAEFSGVDVSKLEAELPPLITEAEFLEREPQLRDLGPAAKPVPTSSASQQRTEWEAQADALQRMLSSREGLDEWLDEEPNQPHRPR